MVRIVVVTNGNYFARLILDRLFHERGSEVKGVVIVEGDYSGKTGLRSLLAVGRKTCLPYLLSKVIQICVFKLARLMFPRAIHDVDRLARKHDIPVLHVTSVNTHTAINFIAQQQPDLLISVSCPQKIGGRILSLPRVAGINIHSSLLPRYAGLAPYYWVLAEGEAETGTTVHLLTEKFDEGNIITQRRIPISPGVSSLRLFAELSRQGSHALVDAVNLVLDGFRGEPQDLSNRSYYSHPNYDSYRRLRRNGFVLARGSELVRMILDEVRHE